MEKMLKDKVAIVTGSGRGIGRAGQGDAHEIIPFVIRSGCGIEEACLANRA